MEYRAVGNRCTVDFSVLNLPIPHPEAIQLLKPLGFNELEVDVVHEVRQRIGRSKYKRGALPTETPEVFDCSSLTKWAYGQLGIWLPRLSIQQYLLGEWVGLEQISPGDLVFVDGPKNYYVSDP